MYYIITISCTYKQCYTTSVGIQRQSSLLILLAHFAGSGKEKGQRERSKTKLIFHFPPPLPVSLQQSLKYIRWQRVMTGLYFSHLSASHAHCRKKKQFTSNTLRTCGFHLVSMRRKEEKTAWEGNQETDPNTQLLHAVRPVMCMSRMLSSLRYTESWITW